MQAAVVYLSRSGHSRKIAEAIAAALQVPAQDIKTDPKLPAVDLLFIAGGIYGGTSDPALLAYVRKLDGGMVKKAALVTSCASGKQKQAHVRAALSAQGIEALPEEFVCKGRFLFVGLGHPNQTDLDNAVAFARQAAGSLA